MLSRISHCILWILERKSRREETDSDTVDGTEAAVLDKGLQQGGSSLGKHAIKLLVRKQVIFIKMHR